MKKFYILAFTAIVFACVALVISFGIVRSTKKHVKVPPAQQEVRTAPEIKKIQHNKFEAPVQDSRTETTEFIIPDGLEIKISEKVFGPDSEIGVKVCTDLVKIMRVVSQSGTQVLEQHGPFTRIGDEDEPESEGDISIDFRNVTVPPLNLSNVASSEEEVQAQLAAGLNYDPMDWEFSGTTGDSISLSDVHREYEEIWEDFYDYGLVKNDFGFDTCSIGGRNYAMTVFLAVEASYHANYPLMFLMIPWYGCDFEDLDLPRYEREAPLRDKLQNSNWEIDIAGVVSTYALITLFGETCGFGAFEYSNTYQFDIVIGIAGRNRLRFYIQEYDGYLQHSNGRRVKFGTVVVIKKLDSIRGTRTETVLEDLAWFTKNIKATDVIYIERQNICDNDFGGPCTCDNIESYLTNYQDYYDDFNSDPCNDYYDSDGEIRYDQGC